MNVPIDNEGILTGVAGPQFHELTYNAVASYCSRHQTAMYIRVGRAADRMSDEPTLPEQWRIERYITPEEVVIELFGENTVIRTDNQDLSGSRPGQFQLPMRTRDSS